MTHKPNCAIHSEPIDEHGSNVFCTCKKGGKKRCVICDKDHSLDKYGWCEQCFNAMTAPPKWSSK
jgi:hypothetical protein